MSIDAECPGCHTKMRVPDATAGRQIKCSTCGTPVMVPGIAKVCHGCGIDVSNIKRWKNSQGHYYCDNCWQAHHTAATATAPPPASHAARRPVAAPVLPELAQASPARYATHQHMTSPPPPQSMRPTPPGMFIPQGIQSRSATSFTVIGALMIVMVLITTIIALIAANSRGDQFFPVIIGAAIISWGVSMAVLVSWLIWISRIHTDLRILSGGQYSTSPGAAVGFSWIPIFSGFWIIYMPYQAALELNRQLMARNLSPISAGLVLGCQIGSVVAGVVTLIPLLNFAILAIPLLYIITVWQIQSGLNRIAQMK